MNPRQTRLDRLCAAAAAAAGAALYASTLSKAFVFEGLARAMPIELGQGPQLLSGNYLAYGPLGSAFHALMTLAGSQAPAVVSLQRLDALLGGAGLAVFFLIQRELGVARAAALCWTAALGATLGWWTWSTDAQAYILSALLLQLVFLALARRLSGRSTPAWAVGLLHALAMMGHIVNGVFALPAAYVLAVTSAPSRRRRELLVYGATLAGAVLAAYAAALLFVRPDDAWRWLLGSAGSDQGVNLRDSWSWRNLGLWLDMSSRVLVTRVPPLDSPAPAAWAKPAGWLAAAALAGAAALAASRWRGLPAARRRAAAAAGLWLLAYAAVFTRWEPYTMVYRVTDLPPALLLLSLGCASAPAGAVLAALLAAANGAGEVLPRTSAGNNPRLSQMELVRAATREGDWVAGEGGGDELYIPHFAQRRPLVIARYRGRPEELKVWVAGRLAAGERVFLTSRVVDDPFWAPHLAGWRLEETARDARGFAVFLVLTVPTKPVT